MTRSSVIASTAIAFVALTTCPSSAHAQRLLVGGSAAAGSGLEIGETKVDGTGMRRARTRLALGADLRNDESPEQAVALIGFAELEPHSSFGAEVFYMRYAGPYVIGFAGFTATLAPHTLFGVEGGLRLHLPAADSGTSLFLQPSVAVLPFGSDLPPDRILVQALFAIGLRMDFSGYRSNE